VISVGNLTVGGTGKTPMTAWIVRQLQDLGRSPAILSRGYKARHGVSDECELLADLTGAPVIRNPNRLAGAKHALAGEQAADILVLDDGFQHMRLRRALDIVLIDATNPFGPGIGCFPLGRMREPRSALRDADAIIITRCDRVSHAKCESLEQTLRRHAPRATMHRACHRPTKVLDENGRELSIRGLAGRSIYAFCGLANPAGFLQTVIDLEVALVGSQALEDHAVYPPDRIETINSMAEKCEADVLLTTQKDGVKLNPADFDLPLWQLTVEMEITHGREELLQAIQRVL
jgi:tetraacyldisaccharide 4'-kinase